MVATTEACHMVVVPLACNAHALLAGSPVESVRRRLKLASLLYERILLEHGVIQVHAGPTGSFMTRHVPDSGTPSAWQTATQRGKVQASTFGVGVGRETTPGIPATEINTLMSSQATIGWVGTLEPFRSELPVGCDWIDYFYRPQSHPAHVSELARRWSSRDEMNQVLAKEFPDRYVRSRIISNANEELAIAAVAGVVLSADPLHIRVIALRLDAETNWSAQGFALPILLPTVVDLDWAAIANLRRDRGIEYLRKTLREVETEALELAVSGGDLEEQIHRTYERRLASAVGRVDSLGVVARRTLAGFGIGTAAGFATSFITGPLGVLAGSALGSVVGAGIDTHHALRARRSKAWVGVMTRIQARTTEQASLKS